MRPTSSWRARLGRVHGAIALAAFLAAGPGVPGLELAFHLAHGAGPGHGTEVHVEEAGAATHGDHCQLSTGAATARLPDRPTARLAPDLAADRLAGPVCFGALVGNRFLPALPRAPPLSTPR
jgi:hypothetical protein